MRSPQLPTVLTAPTSHDGPRGGAVFLLRGAVAILAIALGLGLWLVGLLPDSWRPFLPSLSGALLLGAWAFVRLPRIRMLNRVMLVWITACLTLVVADLVLRVVLRSRYYYRPHDMFVRVWNRLPWLTRYQPSIRYTGRTYGDLAAFSPDPALRELRPTEFETDAYGFRNRRRASASREPYDVILVGDSFVAGCGSSQTSIWSELLETQHGFRTYNLGLPGDPNQAYLNFLVESQRLPLRRGSVVVLALFSGNDLTETHFDIRTAAEVPWQPPLLAFYDACLAFRERSSLRRLAEGIRTGRDPYGLRLSAEQAGLIVGSPIKGRPVLFYRKYCWILDSDEERARLEAHGWELERTLGYFADYCRALDVVLKVVLIPTKEEVYRWVLEEEEPWSTPAESSRLGLWLNHECGALGLDFLDLKPGFVKAARVLYETDGELLWWHDDSHWNPRGHRLAADLVNDLLSGSSVRRDESLELESP